MNVLNYSVNTGPGFSGGPVVLLDQGSDYRMKLVAAHVGYSEDQGVNLAFLLADKVNQYEKSPGGLGVEISVRCSG